MITAVAFVPQAPALDPEVGRGLDAELGGLRAACRDAVTDLARHGRPEVIGEYPHWLLGSEGEPGEGTTLLVVGDGSARRSEKAPGYLDERAAGFDAAVADALRSGEPARLAALDDALGRELLAAGVPAWHEAAARLAGTYRAELRYDDAPFGVGYFVAVWTARAEP